MEFVKADNFTNEHLNENGFYDLLECYDLFEVEGNTFINNRFVKDHEGKLQN